MFVIRLVRSFSDILYAFTFLKFFRRIDAAESNTGLSDLQALFLAARYGWGSGAVVEVGAYKGKSAVALASGTKCAGREKLVSIDPHIEGTEAIFRRNLADRGLEDYVDVRIASSEDARKSFAGPIRFIFIDALHDYASAKQDIELWKGLVIEGGLIAFHDCNYPTVAKVIKELISNGEYLLEEAVGCTAFVSKGVRKNSRLFEAVVTFNILKLIICPWKKSRQLIAFDRV